MDIMSDKGIVLSSRVINEADLLATIITREHGKRKFIFKGIKKSRKRDISVSDAGTFIEIVYYFHENREINIIKSFDVKNSNLEIRDDLEKIYSLYMLVETIEKTSGINDSNPALFSLLSSGIAMLKNSTNPVNLLLFFIIHLINQNGIMPDVTLCSRCGSRNFDSFQMDISDLAIICGNCSPVSERILNSSIKDFLQQSMYKKFKDIDEDIISTDDALQLLFILTLFLEHYFNIRIKSRTLLL